MKRRTLLSAVGAVASLGIADRTTRAPAEPLVVRIWQTEEAAARPSAQKRAAGYVRQALEATGHDVAVSYEEEPLRFDGSDQHVEREAWPKRVVAGVAGASAVDPVRDVNLLLTDGAVARPTAGYAFDHIAAVPGARFLAAMPPADESPAVVDYGVPAAVTQLLVHEVGHALGLDHGHGSVAVDGDTVTVSPMVSGYAWAPDELRADQLPAGICRGGAVKADDRRRRLAMRFSPCAESALRSYRGGLFS
ncbi:hypothetical protein [Halorarius litoreus]|uniref:hypothetical protein n=1 Tax=Halorarius litoreus TaxID=2962676 RepID=UPI0020CCCB1E|nr:hypothetical protein [Halorarius litoreus]